MRPGFEEEEVLDILVDMREISITARETGENGYP
jgi:hypothetical protein